MKINYKKCFKKGFTLAELVLALAIIGICTALMITTVKSPASKAIKYLYINAYTSVERAFYNSMLAGKNPFLQNDISEEEQRKLLKNTLLNFINVKGNANADTIEPAISDAADDSEFDEKHRIFTASNGMHFYLSNIYKAKEDTHAKDLEYFLLYVDINGDRKPNSLVYTYTNEKAKAKKDISKRIDPDIYAFALLETGRIAPLGIPVFNKNILSTGVAYFKTEDDRDTNNNVVYTNFSKPLYVSQAQAWGYYNKENKNPRNIDYDTGDSLTTIGFLHEKLPENSRILTDIPSVEDIINENYQIATDYNCSPQDYHSCYVYLDLYKW